MMSSAPLNSKMVMMLGGNDFDLNQQGRLSYYESATNLFHRKKKKVFTLDLSLQRRHSPKCRILQLSGTIITHTDVSWRSHGLSYFPGAKRWERLTRYHGHACVPKVSLGDASGPASQILTENKSLQNPPHTSPWVSLKNANGEKGGNMGAILRRIAMVFSPLLLKLLFLQPTEINLKAYLL